MSVLLVLSSGMTYPVIYSCEDVHESGFYTLKYRMWSLDVICDADTLGGGWLVILTRFGRNVNFNKPWSMLANQGIGSPETEYILPLKFLHDYLPLETYEMLEEMNDQNKGDLWGLYSHFLIGSEEEKFKLQLAVYDPATPKIDDLSYNNNMKFTTYDQDNDPDARNCAVD